MQPGDPRADPAVVDLIELAGLWLAADDRPALQQTLARLIDVLDQRYELQAEFRERFVTLRELAAQVQRPADELRRAYRRATLG